MKDVNETVDTYLAGGFYTDWRQYLIRALPINAFSPAAHAPQTAAFRFVPADLAAIDGSELVIACYEGGFAAHGMAAEMGWAAAKEIPIFYVDTTPTPDMFLLGLSKRFFRDVDALIAWWLARIERDLPIF